ncbi:SURF1 family protein [Pseudoalteromonas sp. H105]|uniref:SURF1 family protein n=1 Tax=Pseudoalteromonas sp. H105 TaxID=1348393 RepID=UPI000732289E|nr:SURF1 family protein [Pseudoalteromonas sp. H105]KTF13293.1 cytochrome oxidase biogenesis protein [Pseudoalteromonas sp. H105]
MQLVLWRKQKLSSIFIVCVVLVVVFVCLRLSYWQIQRAEAKALQLAHIESVQDQGVMQWSQVQALPVTWDKTGIKVTFRGQVEGQYYWLLDNQIYQGQVGYDVLTLFTPTGSKIPIVANLGWVKAPLTRQQLPTINLPKQPIEMTVQLKQGQLSGFTLENSDTAQSDGWPKRIQNIDLEAFSKQTGTLMADYIGYRQGAGDDLGIPHYQAVVMSPQKHYGYAVQWLLIGLACIGVAVFASKKKDLK